MLMADFLRDCRLAASDDAESNFSGSEDCLVHEQNRLDGVTTIFALLNKRIIASSFMAVNNGVPIVPVEIKAREGYVRFDSSAPPQPDRLYFMYYWQHLTDAEFNSCVSSALSQCSLAQNVTEISDDILHFVKNFVLAYMYQAMATRHADYYPIQVGGKTVGKDQLFQHYSKMYEDYLMKATGERDAFYSGQSKQLYPSAEVTSSEDMDYYERYWKVD